MDGLIRIKAALARIESGELEVMMAATYITPPLGAPGLIAWIDTACDWELQRRRGLDYELPPPEAAIPPAEDGVSIRMAGQLRAGFAAEGCAPAMSAFLDALLALLTGRAERKH